MYSVSKINPIILDTLEPRSDRDTEDMLKTFRMKSREALEGYSRPSQTVDSFWKRTKDSTADTAKTLAQTLYDQSSWKWPSYPANERRRILWRLQTELMHQSNITPDRYEMYCTVTLERVPVGTEPLAEVLTAQRMLVVRKEPSERTINWPS